MYVKQALSVHHVNFSCPGLSFSCIFSAMQLFKILMTFIMLTSGMSFSNCLISQTCKGVQYQKFDTTSRTLLWHQRSWRVGQFMLKRNSPTATTSRDVQATYILCLTISKIRPMMYVSYYEKEICGLRCNVSRWVIASVAKRLSSRIDNEVGAPHPKIHVL